MNAICSICSDLLINKEDVVTTKCGHVFHKTCLTNWLESSMTCPSCRTITTSDSLMKLFFVTDENKTDVLKLDEILKNNEETSKLLREEKERFVKTQSDLIESRTKIKELMGKIKELEFLKSTDVANIEGLKGIKRELETEVIKDKEMIRNLKLDLLAERDLRRNLQLQMHQMKPNDQTFNIASIKDDEYLSKTSTNGDDVTSTSITTSSNKSTWTNQVLNTEIKPMKKDQNDEKPRNHLIPKKIQKATDPKESFMKSFKNNIVWKGSFSSPTSTDKPKAFDFSSPKTTEPSTSTGVKRPTFPPSLIQPGLFGNNNNIDSKSSFQFTAKPSTSQVNESSSFRTSSQHLSFDQLSNSLQSSSSSPLTTSNITLDESNSNTNGTNRRFGFSLGLSHRNLNDLSPDSPKSNNSTFNFGPKASER